MNGEHERPIPSASRACECTADEWRTVPFAPGYRISSRGVVVGPVGRPLRSWRHKSGHLYLRLGRSVRAWQIHRLVLCVFAGAPPDLREARHLDSDPTHNCLGNLRWDTRSQNLRDAVEIRKRRDGRAAGSARLTTTDVDSLCAMVDAGVPYATIAARFAVTVGHVSAIAQGYEWAWHTGRTPAQFKRNTRLRPEQISEIRAALQSGDRQLAIAGRYGVSQSCISNIKRGAIWSTA